MTYFKLISLDSSTEKEEIYEIPQTVGLQPLSGSRFGPGHNTHVQVHRPSWV